jgi:flagellar biosynthetic protein FliP
MKRALVSTLAMAVATGAALAQQADFADIARQLTAPTSDRMIFLAGLLTILSLAPGIMLMVTSFTRIVVVLSILRTGIGLQSTPANMILISLALFMTAFIMAPTLERAYRDGMQPLMEKKISEAEAIQKVILPFREFMQTQVREKDLRLFQDLSGAPAPQNPSEVELRILVPAFMISELRRGFEIGFMIVIPFLIIDLIVATIVMSMGMMMMPPSVISLPLKIMFFVLIDGWYLLVGTIVRSF